MQLATALTVVYIFDSYEVDMVTAVTLGYTGLNMLHMGGDINAGFSKNLLNKFKPYVLHSERFTANGQNILHSENSSPAPADSSSSIAKTSSLPVNAPGTSSTQLVGTSSNISNIPLYQQKINF